MCLYPVLRQNPKYKANKKNGGKVPAIYDIKDKRILAVPTKCGRCYECMKQRANEWRVRLFEETKTNKNGHFVTLNFSDENYKKLYKEIKDKGYEADNKIATLAVRRFLERWRKKHKKSVRHWLVTELGQQNKENIHLHGIIWTNENVEEINKHWKYGKVWAGYEKQRTYVNEKTVNYITKYITKQDEKHRYYIPKVLTSPGIGSNYINTLNAKNNTYKKGETKEHYVTRTGHKISMPVYYRNKIYSDEEKEKLWIEKLDKETRYVDGIKIDVKNSQEEYKKIRNQARKKYIQLGYNGEKDWKDASYEHQRRVLLQEERIERAKE